MGVGGALANLEVVLKLRDELSAGLDQVGQSVSATGEKIQGLGPKAAALGGSMQTAGIAMTGVGLGARLMAQDVESSIVPFDAALKGIKSIGASDSELDAIKASALAISSELPVGAQAIVESAYLIKSAGFEDIPIADFMREISEVAVAGGEDVKEVTGTVITALGAGYSEIGEITAALAGGVKLGKYEMGEFGAEMQKNISTGAGLGMSFQEIAAANVIMQNAFSSSEEAGTGLKTMLAALVDPAKVADLEKMGVKVKDSEGNFVGLEEVLKQLGPVMEKTGGNVEQQGALFEIFGSYGVKAAQALLENKDAYSQYTDELSDGTAVQTMMGAQLESTAAKQEIANNKMENAKIAFGEAMAPASEFAATLKGKVADALTGLPAPLQAMAGSAVIGAQGFLALGPAVAGAGTAIKHSQGLMKPLGEAVQGIGGGISTLLPKLAGAGGLTGAFSLLSGGVMGAIGPLVAFLAPLAAPIVIIAAVAAAIYLLNERFNFIGGIIEWLGGVWKGLGDWLGSTFGPILEGITGFFGELFGEIDGAAGPVEALLGWFKGLGETLLSVGGYIGGILTSIIQGFASLIGAVLGPAIRFVVDVLGTLAGILGGVLMTALNAIWTTAVAVGAFLVQTFGPAWDQLRVIIETAWNAIAALFAPGGPTDLVGILAGIWNAIATAVPAAWGIILEAVVAGAQAIWTWLSTEGARLAGEAVGMIWTFITETVPTAWGIIYQAVKDAAIGIWTWLSTEGLQLAGEAVKAIWDAICTYVPVAWGLILDALKGIWTTITGWFSGDANTEANGAVKGIWDAICTYVPIAWTAIKDALIATVATIWGWLKTDGKDLFFFAVKLIWDVITEYIPTAWDLIKQAVVTAAGIIWNWLKTDGVDLGGKAVKAIWDWICEKVPAAWEAIKGAVIAAAQLIWNWMKDTAPGLAVAAIGAAWSAIAGAVPAAWEAIKSAVATAAQNVWNEAQRILKKVFTFELPDIVGAARRAYDAAQRALKGDDSAGPAVAPSAAPGIDLDNPVAVAPSQNGGRWVDGHYVSPGANGYWDHGTWVPVHHTGGIYDAPDGSSEGLAFLQSGERVLSRSQTQSFDRLLRALENGGGLANGGVTIEHVTLAQDYPYDRLLRDIRREIAMTRSARGILS